MLEKYEGEKRKQWLYLAIAVSIGVGILLILSTLMGGNKQITKKEVPKIKIVDDKDVEEEPFKKVYGKKIGLLEEEIKQLKKEIKMTNELLKEKQVPAVMPPIEGGFKQPENTTQVQAKEPKLITPQQIQSATPIQPPLNGNVQNQKQQKKISVQVLDNLIAFEGNTEDTPVIEQNNKNNQKQKESKKKTVKNTIPAGSFVRAVLLSGLDAPTSGNAIRSPHPVLFKLLNKAILPNRWKINIKDCFIIGSGYGDLSSERAYIRLERLSCTKNDGSIISKSVEGYVSGEDGKNGLKGRVVSKQGQLLARTLVAGFLQGVSQAFSYSQQSLLIPPQGAVQTVNPNQALQYAGINGISEAAKKLADFYMNLVNKTFPVIEILPGRKVDIVFLKDVNLEE